MIANSFGHRLELAALKTRYRASDRGATVRDIVEWADELALTCKVVRLELTALSDIALPAMLHWGFDHFVVLENAGRRDYSIVDPDGGRRHVNAQEMSDMFTGIALEFSRQPSFAPVERRNKRLALSRLWPRVTGDRLSFAMILLLSLLLQASALLMPLYTKWVIDDIVGRGESAVLDGLVAAFAGLVLVSAMTMLGRSSIALVLGTRTAEALIGGLVRRILAVKPAWFERRHLGEIASRFASTAEIQTFILGQGLSSLLDLLVLLAAGGILMSINAPLAALVLITIGLAILLNVSAGRRLAGLERTKVIYQGQQTSIFLETIRNITQIKLRSAEGNRWAGWKASFDQMLLSETKVAFGAALLDAAQYVILTLGAIIIVWVGARMILVAKLSTGTLLAFMMFYYITNASTQRIGRALFSLAMIRVHLDRVAEIVFADQEPVAEDSDGIDRTWNDPYKIDLRAVSYAHPGARHVLLDAVSLTLEPGIFLAVKGRTGSGKTTLMKLILGLLVPTAGQVLVNGRALDGSSVKSFRRGIGVVLQEDRLLSGTIAENIAFFAPNADETQIVKVAKVACIHDDIMRLPMRYDTQVGELGAALSGGETQRILLARALFDSPRLLVLDEGTSHVDLDTEREINANLSRLNMTRLVISHRPHIFELADCVYELAGGRLVLVHTNRTSRRDDSAELSQQQLASLDMAVLQ